MSKERGFSGIVILVWLAMLAVGGYGWVMNIIKIAGAGFDPLSGLVVLRVVGVFVAPLGAVLGYIG